MSETLAMWWAALCAVAVLNGAALLASAAVLKRRKATLPAQTYASRRLLIGLAAVYVLGCAFRSFHPMVDVSRMCLNDGWMGRVFVGRSIATLAEIAFAAQWTLLLREANAVARSAFTAFVTRALLPLIVLAETASWLAVLTTDNLFHALENSLWTMAAVLAVGTCVALRSQLDARSRRFLSAAILCGILYVAFMIGVDVPMYVSRWMADTAAGHPNLGLAGGLYEVLQRCTVVREWAAWREDALWLTLYFTVAVWVSLALPHAPVFASGRR